MSAYFHFYLCGRKAAEWLINMKRTRLAALTLAALLLAGCARTSPAPDGSGSSQLSGSTSAAENSGPNVQVDWSKLEGEETSLCRHRETGRVLSILNRYLRQGPDGLWCEDSTDYALPVSPGDTLTVVAATKEGFLCKKEGVTGWYYGRLSGIMGETTEK